MRWSTSPLNFMLLEVVLHEFVSPYFFCPILFLIDIDTRDLLNSDPVLDFEEAWKYLPSRPSALLP